MLNSSLVMCLILIVGATFSLPMKNNEMDDFVLRLNPYAENGIADMLEKGRFRSRRMQVNPLLYEIYLNAIDAALTHRGDEQSMDLSDRREMIKKNFDEIDRTGFKHLKRNFDEIDRVGFSELKRSV